MGKNAVCPSAAMGGGQAGAGGTSLSLSEGHRFTGNHALRSPKSHTIRVKAVGEELWPFISWSRRFSSGKV